MTESVSVTLGGVTYRMVPTYGAYARVEESTDYTLRELISAHADGKLKLAEAAAIVFAGLHANPVHSGIEYDAVMQRVYEAPMGSKPLRRAIAEFMFALYYTPDDLGKELAAFLNHEDGGKEPGRTI